jgi:hypothetical protein
MPTTASFLVTKYVTSTVKGRMCEKNGTKPRIGAAVPTRNISRFAPTVGAIRVETIVMEELFMAAKPSCIGQI